MDHLSLQQYRAEQLKFIPNTPGVYGLADPFNSTLYVGTSENLLRGRVQRHITSGRSDVLANKKLCVSDIGFVWYIEEDDPDRRKKLEDLLIYQHHNHRLLMNAKVPPTEPELIDVPDRTFVQLMPDDELAQRKQPIVAYKHHLHMQFKLLEYIETTKDNAEMRTALQARVNLTNYHRDIFERSQRCN